ncbi:MAG: MBL fold metallo-hydrolase [Candidatus Wallbacteria bacterium]|nr:MBL fold metallo-hydrolase [Candidatus Wallbacteria bacterium]
MKLTFLGGADEIGASSILVETAGHRVLVDCGLRMGGAKQDPLPDLRAIQDAGGLDAIVLTHAHLDHTGGLPVLHAACPDVPVLATAPTWTLLKILLLDAVKIMGSKLDREGELPLYSQEAVEALLARGTSTRFLEPREVAGGAVTITHYPAGHILGASSVGIESAEGRALVTGDYSVTDQITVPGMLPPRLHADVVVTESTYGDRLHASRPAEERRLVETVGEVVAAGGKVLIPAFALGRAQEVLLALRRAFARKTLKPFPVWVDGMVRSVCCAYADHPDWVSPWLRRQIEKRGNPFFDTDGSVQQVLKPSQRAEIAQGPPCCIVASSGMLTGGPSQQFAAMLAPDPKNFIAITGYQDEEAPGRTLLDLADGRAHELKLSGEIVPVSCRVGRYSLSAHADGGEVASLVGHLRPKDVVLVHGEGQARPALGRSVGPRARDGVYLPVLGETLTFSYRQARPRPPRAALEGFGLGRPMDEAGIAELAARLGSGAAFGGQSPQLYDLKELASLYAGDQGSSDAGLREQMRALLLAEASPFEPDPRRPFLFRLRRRESPPEAGEASSWAAPAVPGQPMQQTAALARAAALFPPSTGLLKTSLRLEAKLIELVFPFPEAARRRHAGLLLQLSQETGWKVAVHPEVRPAALIDLVRRLLPADWELTRSPGWHREQNRLVVSLGAVPPDWIDQRTALAAQFEEESGVRLELERTSQPAAAALDTARDSEGRLEVNLAIAAIDHHFAGLPHRPTRKSRRVDSDGPYLELAFISVRVAERYSETIAQAAADTGWRLTVASKSDQEAILRTFRELWPAAWIVSKGPSLFTDRGVLRVVVRAMPSLAELSPIRTALADRTGFELEVGLH